MLTLTLLCLATVDGTLAANAERGVRREWATGEHSASLSLLKLVCDDVVELDNYLCATSANI